MGNSGEEYIFTLPKRNNVDDIEDWERYSENYRPARHGRKIDALRQKPMILTEESAREKLDNLLLEIQNNPSFTDEMKQILDFCSWFESNFTIGHQKLYYELLWKIINRNNFVSKYANDDRMIKIWEKISDNSCGHAHEIYQYAVSKNSCTRNAALYVRWSQCVELSGAIVEARRILLLARSNLAVPLELINNAEDELEMRDLRRHLKEESCEEDDDEEETRHLFTHLKVNSKNEAPIVRISSEVRDETKKPLIFDRTNSIRIGANEKNQMQPFEVFSYNDREDVEYLMNVHELNPHIERHALKETTNPKIFELKSGNGVEIVPLSSEFEVWTIESSNANNRKAKAKMAIKRIFKDLSFEEFCAQMENHPSMAKRGVPKLLNFDQSF